jgi:PAS domain S-box-containing protein
MDVQMPGLDGFQTASLIKVRERTRHIPIIFLTAISKDAAHVFMGYAHGAVDYLLKPFDPEILRSKVSVFVELYLRSESLRQKEIVLRARERSLLQRQNEARFRSLTESLPVSLWAMRTDGSAYYSNPQWKEFSGLDDAQMEAGALWSLFHPDEQAHAQEAFAEVRRTHGTLSAEYRLRNRCGEYRWMSLRCYPERNESGEVVGWLATTFDVDDLKKAREEAEAANRSKDEFLATVSHELRNPLNAIVGWTRMLRTGKLSPDKVARALETIERNAGIQTSLVEDILDVSRIITGKLTLKLAEVGLSAVVDAAVDTVRPAAEAKGITVDIERAPGADLVSADADRLQQVVWNLLSNAIRFTPPGGRVLVRTRRVTSSIEVMVKDSGVGIGRDFLPHVFERFRQADSSSTRSHNGLGLGLAIVRHLVELHGGTVRVDSDGEGHGASFTVQLPIRPLSQPMSDPPAGPPRSRPRVSFDQAPSLEGIRLLVVDDEADVRELLSAVLEHHGAAVTAVGSAREALEMVPVCRPDVVISDIGMPDEDGYALIQRLRARGDRQGQIPAVALTGFARSEDGRRALSGGFQTYLCKPVEPATLIDVVAGLARPARATVADSTA